MRYTVAICPDDYTAQGKPPESDAASPKWARLLQAAGHEVRWVDVRRPDIIDQLRGCQGFMWRWAHFDGMGRIARRLLPVIERELQLVTYPDQNTCWHYDDKIAQSFLFKALGIPAPKTWIWFHREQALAWVKTARYPLVIKLATGAASENVIRVTKPEEAAQWIDTLFTARVTNLKLRPFQSLPLWRRLRGTARILIKGQPPIFTDNGYDAQSGYVFFQEFLPGNSYDTRVTVIGNRAFAFRRFNRPNDFRASGSGNISFEQQDIDPRFIRLAFQTANSIRSQSCAIDGLYRDGTCVVGEISYTYVSSAIYSCPGHWELTGAPLTGELVWREGQIWPEDAQIQDFLLRLRSRTAIS